MSLLLCLWVYLHGATENIKGWTQPFSLVFRKSTNLKRLNEYVVKINASRPRLGRFPIGFCKMNLGFDQHRDMNKNAHFKAQSKSNVTTNLQISLLLRIWVYFHGYGSTQKIQVDTFYTWTDCAFWPLLRGWTRPFSLVFRKMYNFKRSNE